MKIVCQGARSEGGSPNTYVALPSFCGSSGHARVLSSVLAMNDIHLPQESRWNSWKHGKAVPVVRSGAYVFYAKPLSRCGDKVDVRVWCRRDEAIRKENRDKWFGFDG